MGDTISATTDAALACLAYLQEPNIQVQLGEVPELDGWSVMWGPTLFGPLESALLLSKQPENPNRRTQSALVLRSRIPDCERLFDNLDLSLRALPWKQPGFQQAECGSNLVRSAVQLMEHLGGAKAETLLEKLNLEAPNTDLRIVGHSTGGALACLMALWIRHALQPLHGIGIWPRVFGAPTPGNEAFANAFRRCFPRATHFASSLDISPLTWSVDGLEKILHLFPEDHGPSALERGLLHVAKKEIASLGYTQIPGQILLNAKLRLDLPFQSHAKWQHHIHQYLELLRSPTLAVR
jgi:triacylglycerol lipase